SDDNGNRSVANADVWIAGKDEWWFNASGNDRIDLLPEKKNYQPGETARFQLRMPFRSATALITVEREGVMESYVRKLSGNEPVFEIPMKGNYSPNVFVSALVVRGRVSEVKPTALVDLGKPAFKLGITEIKVGHKAYELKVAVTADKEVYNVREKAKVRIMVSNINGDPLPKGSEVAIAAVDEGLLELMPNKSWELLEAMTGRRGYGVHTATAQMEVVGKRHYGLKALPQGGGGGRQPTRELFETLLLWKARVVLNQKGEAVVDVPLNDSITSFRIVAVAGGGAGLFGTGQTSIRASQDLMVLSGLPQVVREDDAFKAGFTVRNASGRAMEVEVGAAIGAIDKKEREHISVALKPGEAKEVGWDIRVPVGIDRLQYEVTAREIGGIARDGIKVKQRVAEELPVRAFQTLLTQIDGSYSMSVEKPHDALAAKGGVTISLRPKLAGSLNGVITYMKRYPYGCMEQRVSRAIALRDGALWRKVVAELPSFLDGDGLVKYFPSMQQGSDALTSYVLSISDEAGWPIPPSERDKMEEGLKKFVEGKVIRYSSLPVADLSIRKIGAIEALARAGKAEARMLGSITLEPNLWPTSSVLSWTNVLLRSPSLPDRDKLLKEAEQIIRSRLNFQGSTMGFSTEATDYLWWLMVSGDFNAVKSITTMLHFDSWKQDMPRLVRGALGRQHQGRWALTTANAWGVLAMEKFSRMFESVPATGSTVVAVNGKEQSQKWAKYPDGKTLGFHWAKDRTEIVLRHDGKGKPWAMVQSTAAIPLKEPFSSGYKITKTLIPVESKAAGKWSKGDVVRVRLETEAQSDMSWVVISDPIPTGAGILGTGLGRDSQLLTNDEKRQGWVWPAFEERSMEAFRAYYEYVPKGKWVVEYTLRLNNSGTFHLPPTRAEALYSPEMLGELPNNNIEVVQ
ncbi:MAG: alpha-2-macroglobulin, partial [Nitrospirae bacterium]|nr:alpha-2-macroglobulin [Nitrospirota bacterium]